MKPPSIPDWFRERFELSRGEAHNLRSMEGLRGFAVFLVFLVHYTTFIEPWIGESSTWTLALGRILHTIGNTGVDLFFVLSGYLIYGMLIDRDQPFLSFLSRRARRLYPAFLAVFVIYLVLSAVFPDRSKIPDGSVDAGLYLAANLFFLPGIFPIEPMITVAWSLSYEMFYYVTIPCIILAFALNRRSRVWRLFFLSGIAMVTAIVCAIFGGPVRLVMFISGIVLYETIKWARLTAPRGAVALAVLAAGLASTLLPLAGAPGAAVKTSILFACFFVLCFACFGNPGGWLGRAFSWTPIRWLGNMSYSYYLLHGLTLQAAFLALAMLLPPGPHGFGFFAIAMAAMFGLSLLPPAVLFLAIERPLSLVRARSRGVASGATGVPATSEPGPGSSKSVP